MFSSLLRGLFKHYFVLVIYSCVKSMAVSLIGNGGYCSDLAELSSCDRNHYRWQK